MDGVFEKIEEALEQYQMLPAQGRIVLGLSGGADSMTLAHFFASREDLRRRLLCAHVNHGIRGEEALRDERFVTEWCKSRGIPCAVHNADVPAEAARTGEGEEACGRRIRYAFFETLAASPNDRIAVAHNADDQTETVLLHLVRGAGLQGLCGMAPVRGKVIRPLLQVTRGEIEANARATGLRYMEDSTNAQDAYSRNRLRHTVVPELLKMNPALHAAMARTARTLAADETCLQAMAVQALRKAAGKFPGTLRCDVLTSQPDAAAVRAVRRWMEQQGVPFLEEQHLQNAMRVLRQGGTTPLPGRWDLSAAGNTAVLLPPVGKDLPKKVEAGVCVVSEGRLELIFAEHAHKIHNLLFKNTLDCDTIKSDLILRRRVPGDRFAWCGRTAKPLKDLFYEAGVPAPLRDRLWVLECEGNIVWTEWLGAGEAYAAKPDTRRVLRICPYRLGSTHMDIDGCGSSVSEFLPEYREIKE